MKEFEEALKAANNTEALEILDKLRDRDRANRTIRPARRLTGRKMTPELAAEILHLHHTTDMTQQEIAFQLGVNQGRVNEVIKRGKWLDGDPNAPEAVARDKAKERAKEGVGFAPRPPRKKKAAKPKAEPEAVVPEAAAPEPEAVVAPPEPVAPAPEPVAPEPVAAAVEPEAEAPKPSKKSGKPKAAKEKPAPKDKSGQLLFDGI
nr:hypothetical protein [Azospirillum rugosum]